LKTYEVLKNIHHRLNI
jgi:hypothetical protein